MLVSGNFTVTPFDGAGLNGVGAWSNVAANFVAGAGPAGALKYLFMVLLILKELQSKGAAGAGIGNSAARNSIEPVLTQFSNSPIIIRRSIRTVSGSDMAQIGWVEVATEDGTSGYLWYLKAESETRLRFEDYLEMSMVESEYNQIAVLV